MASIEKRGDKYVVRYRDDDDTQRSKSFDLSRDAKVFKASIDGGNIPIVSKMTVATYLREWYAANGSPPLVRPNTAASYKNDIEKHIIPEIGDIVLVNLTRKRIQTMYNILATRERVTSSKTLPPLSAKSIKNIHCTLSQALSKAVEDGLLRSNPALSTKRPKVVTRPYDAPEIGKFKELLERIDEESISCAIYACAFLGSRRGETLGIFWPAYNETTFEVLICRQLTFNNLTGQIELTNILKTSKSYRRLPVPKLLAQKIAAERTRQKKNRLLYGSQSIKSDFMFVDDLGRPLNPTRITNAFKRCARDVGLGDMHLHDLRGAFASYLFANNVDPKTVQELLGHTTTDFTMRVYASALSSNKHHAADVVDAILK